MFEIIREDYKHQGAIKDAGKGQFRLHMQSWKHIRLPYVPFACTQDRFQYSNSLVVLPAKLQAASLPWLPL